MINYDPFRVKERDSKSGKPLGRSLVLENLIKENNLKTGAELGVRSRAKFIRDWITEAVKQVSDNSLDFIFIDADHSYKSVVRDIQDWKPKVKKGGYITGHDWYQSPVKRAVTDVLGVENIKVKQDNVWVYRSLK